jgi:hypothetical protein
MPAGEWLPADSLKNVHRHKYWLQLVTTYINRLPTLWGVSTGESEARAKTRDRFNEVLKKYTDPQPGKKKVKKKSSEPQSESIVVGC